MLRRGQKRGLVKALRSHPRCCYRRDGWRVVRHPITELDFEITYEDVLSRGEPPELPRDLFRDEEVPLAVRFRS